uniref:Extensin-like n=1 Tax=Nicotiana tabacum TaxID=4097 RepID=A0A1S3YUF0_TOBAC|nr:PREDICTED: extensin-like [Nicotiana tabacum]
MTPKRFAEVSLNVARHISADLERIYRNVGAWVSGRPPPQGPSEGTSTIPQATQTPLHATSDLILPPGYVPNYSLHAAPGTFNMQPPVAPFRNTPLVVSSAPVYTIPLPPPVTRPNNEPLPQVYDGQYYSPNMAFRASAPYNQTPKYESLVEKKKPAKTSPLQYTVFNSQSYARPPNQQVQAPAPRAPRPQQKNFWAPYNACPRKDYG